MESILVDAQLKEANSTLTSTQRTFGLVLFLSKVMNCTLSLCHYHDCYFYSETNLGCASFVGSATSVEDLPPRRQEDAETGFCCLLRVRDLSQLASLPPRSRENCQFATQCVLKAAARFFCRLSTIVTGKLINTSTVDPLLATKSHFSAVLMASFRGEEKKDS